MKNGKWQSGRGKHTKPAKANAIPRFSISFPAAALALPALLACLPECRMSIKHSLNLVIIQIILLYDLNTNDSLLLLLRLLRFIFIAISGAAAAAS